MTGWNLLFAWEFSPSVVVGCVLLLGIYFYANRFKFDGKALAYTSGVLCLFLALCSPIDTLGDDYLFSAHMLQHMMLGTIVPPLLIAGLPASFVQSWLRFPIIARLERIFGNPALALIVGCSTFWVWHLPYLYNLALENETVHLVEHILFIVTGTMLFWPVLKPIPEGRLSALSAIVYMGIAATLGMILGIIFTISDTVFYSFYLHPKEDELGALKLIRDDWGLTPLDDQKLGGAIMWEPMSVIFLWASLAAMFNWFKHSEHEAVHESVFPDKEFRGEAFQEKSRRAENVGTK
jgi:cytochrome c oxidase assembly factor CtaG